jgi:hypothetical protein
MLEKAGTRKPLNCQSFQNLVAAFGRLCCFDKLRAQKLWHVVSRMPHLKHRRLSSSLHLMHTKRVVVCARPQNLYTKRKNKFSHYLFKLKSRERAHYLLEKSGSKGSLTDLYLLYLCVRCSSSLFFCTKVHDVCAPWHKSISAGMVGFKEAECSVDEVLWCWLRARRGVRATRDYIICASSENNPHRVSTMCSCMHRAAFLFNSFLAALMRENERDPFGE